MMRITWDIRRKDILLVAGRVVKASCHVRNEVNGERPLAYKPAQDEVVRTIPDGIPYMPREFPKGWWKIGRPVARTHPYKAPFYIPTDAYQMLPEWDLDEDGGYLKEIPHRLVRDEDYGLHCSSSKTTLGCIRITHEKDLLWLVDLINEKLDHEEEVFLEAV